MKFLQMVHLYDMENVTNVINVSKHGVKLKNHNQISPLTWNIMCHDGLDHGVEIWFGKIVRKGSMHNAFVKIYLHKSEKSK